MRRRWVSTLGAGFCAVLTFGASAGPYPLEVVATERHHHWDYPVLSPDGRQVAYSVKRATSRPDVSLKNGLQMHRSWAPDQCGGQRLLVLDLKSRRSRSVGPSDWNTFQPSWSPDGETLVYFAERPTQASVALMVDRPGAAPRRLAGFRPMPDYANQEAAPWLDASHIVVARVTPGDRAWMAGLVADSRGLPETLSTQPGSEAATSNPWTRFGSFCPTVLDVNTGKTRDLPTMPGAWKPNRVVLSPSRKKIAYWTTFHLKDKSPVCQLVVGSVDGKGRWLRVDDLPFNDDEFWVRWHPSAERLFVHTRRRLFELSLADGALHPIGPEPLDYPFSFAPDGNSVYTLEASAVLAPTWFSPNRSPKRVVCIPLDGGAVRRLPGEGQFRIIEAQPGRAWQPPTGEVAVLDSTSEGCVAQFLSSTTSSRWPLQAGKASFVAGLPGAMLLLRFQSSRHPEELVRWEATGIHRLTETEPRLRGVETGRLEHLTTAVGNHTVGTTISLPASFVAGHPPPALVTLYPGAFRSNDALGFQGATLFPTPLYTTRGYAVLACDAPIGPGGVPGEPLRELVDVIEPQIRHAAEEGWIDPTRVGVIGHSHGGYAVAALLSGSKMFRAGVALDGLYDLAGCYSEGPTSELPFLTGQLRMGVSPWQDPERYWRNSPYGQADHIEAPLMLVVGGADRGCPPWEATRMFHALRSQGKVAELAIYPGEDHVPTSWTPQHQLDLCQRMLHFLEQHLQST